MLAAVDADNDRVALFELGDDGVRTAGEIHVGRRPAQAVFGDDARLFVTERGDQTVSAYDMRTGRRLCRTDAGLDPFGLALAPRTLTLLVTSGIDHKLVAIDTDDFHTRYEVPVPREPRGVVVNRDETRAFVSHLAGEPLSMVSLELDEPKRAITIARAPILGDGGEPDTHPFDRRDGPVETRLPTREERIDAREGEFEPQPGHVVRPRPSQAWSVAIDEATQHVFVAFMLNRTGDAAAIGADEGSSDDGGYGAGVVEESERTSFALGEFDPGTERWVRVVQPRASGNTIRVPSGIAIAPDHSVWVSSMGTNSVTHIALGADDESWQDAPLSAPCGIAVTRDGTAAALSPFTHALWVRRTPSDREIVSLGEHVPDDAEVAIGRALFHAADDPRISLRGLSCAGCHPDGRDDGLVWFLRDGARQTPTLAGRLARPFNWNGSQPTLERSIEQTIHRIGGTGLGAPELAALASYLTRGLFVPERRPRTLTAIEEHGRELFSGAANCDGCHVPERNFTDGARHRFAGSRFHDTVGRFDTPSLAFVEGTAPYFHDGRFATLGDVLSNATHRMGRSASLAPDDASALEAYLRTL
jgi:DNA-binding beta-propeller fold protein YncE